MIIDDVLMTEGDVIDFSSERAKRKKLPRTDDAAYRMVHSLFMDHPVNNIVAAPALKQGLPDGMSWIYYFDLSLPMIKSNGVPYLKSRRVPEMTAIRLVMLHKDEIISGFKDLRKKLLDIVSDDPKANEYITMKEAEINYIIASVLDIFHCMDTVLDSYGVDKDIGLMTETK